MWDGSSTQVHIIYASRVKRHLDCNECIWFWIVMQKNLSAFLLWSWSAATVVLTMLACRQMLYVDVRLASCLIITWHIWDLRVRSSSRTTNAQTMTRPGEYLQTSDPGLRRKQWMIIVFSRSSLSRSTEVSVGLMVSPPPSPLLPPVWLLKSLSFGMTWLALEAVSHRTACHCKPQSTISSFEYSLDFLLKKPIWRCRKHRYKYRNCCCNSSHSVLLRSSGQLG